MAVPNNVVSFADRAKSFGLPERKIAGGGEPPHNDGMEARVTALEESVKNLPTKTDFAELRTDFATLRADMAKSQSDMHKAIADNHRWTHGALIGIATIGVVGIIGVMGAIWNAGKPSATPAPMTQQQQPPIIINVPAASPAPTPAPQQ